MRIQAVDFYLLRTPALPISAIQPTSRSFDDQLKSLWNEGAIAEAVFVASPVLYQQIKSHVETNAWPLTPALQQTLSKYALRMSTRATPFGLLAGCSVGTVSDTTRIELATEQRFVPHRRLDMDCVARVVRQLDTDPIIQPQLRFFPNNSHYKIGQEVRYVERQDTGTERHYFVSSVRVSVHLLAVLQRAAAGATSNQLVSLLTDRGIAFEDATFFFSELIEQQLLVSELEPMLTGPPILTKLRNQLSRLAGTESVQQALGQIEQCLADPVDTRQVQMRINQCLTNHFPLLPTQHLIQTDLFINTSANTISQQVTKRITQQFERLLPLSQQFKSNRLNEFAGQFLERYDRREVPLLEALDAERGIGYGPASGTQNDVNPLLDELMLPEADELAPIRWGAYEDLLVAKLSQALRERSVSVELTDNELTPFGKPDFAQLPVSLYLFGNLLGESANGIDQERFFFNLLGAGGPSAATLLGRFCAHSTELTARVRACLQREEQQRPDAIYAEIIHWPDNRPGNILIRPALRPFEIPYISQSFVDEDHQLPLNDLLVSIRPDGRVILRSRRYNKEVIPRLSTAHNYRNGLSTYQFLTDLQQQDGQLVHPWNWGPLSDQPFLPRITYQNLIISRARWTISRDGLPESSTDLTAYLRATYQLPRWVAITDGDNELALDLEMPIGQQLLADEIKRKATTSLVEWVATPDQCWLRDGQGAPFVNELVIPCEIPIVPASSSDLGYRAVKPARTVAPGGSSKLITRSFAPGTEWFYLKLYCGTQTAEEVLKTVVYPLVSQLMDEQLIDNHFFVRYADPQPHLRLRLHSLVPGFVGPVLTRLNELIAGYQQSGSVYRVQIDTYEREIERYGAATMLDSEHLFAADSWATLSYLSQETDPADRWRFALQSCEALLTDFGQDIFAKVRLFRQLQEQFLAEYRADKALRKTLNGRFREAEEQISHDLLPVAYDGGPPEYSDQPAINTILAERSIRLQPLGQRIRAHAGNRADDQSLFDLLASYLHMSLNRLFASQQRTHELVLYHFLARHYQSQQARQVLKAKGQDECRPVLDERIGRLV